MEIEDEDVMPVEWGHQKLNMLNKSWMNYFRDRLLAMYCLQCVATDIWKTGGNRK